MPTNSQHQAAGRSARIATPLTRYLPLITASLILAACGNSGSPSPPSVGGTSSTPPSAAPGMTTGNSGPSISGKPLVVATVNVDYSFRPEAYDPDGDVLIFQVSRLPPWATFNPATGEIRGVPPTSSTGTFSDIQITVTDGKLMSTLPAFSITVTESSSASPTGTGSATLSWTVPTQNDDGSPLNNLAGYRIYYGQAPSDLNQRMEIIDASQTSTETPLLTGGTWYFAMTSVNSSGVESGRTGVVMKAL